MTRSIFYDFFVLTYGGVCWILALRYTLGPFAMRYNIVLLICLNIPPSYPRLPINRLALILTQLSLGIQIILQRQLPFPNQSTQWGCYRYVLTNIVIL